MVRCDHRRDATEAVAAFVRARLAGFGEWPNRSGVSDSGLIHLAPQEGPLALLVERDELGLEASNHRDDVVRVGRPELPEELRAVLVEADQLRFEVPTRSGKELVDFIRGRHE